MNDFFLRLKQRKLVQWAIAYVAAAFALLQGIDIVGQQFGWPEAVRRGITLALVVGFFVTLVIAWYHGERGVQRVSGTELLIIGLVLALGGGFLWRFAATSHAPDNKTSTVPNETKTTEPAVAIPEKSIAVLPFENLSEEKSNAFFADGVQDEILTDLSRIADLKVISRTSVMQYKDTTKRNLPEIAQALKVAHVLEGSVQRAANRVRVNAQLIDAQTDTHLWAQRFDGDLADVFAIQTEIAQKIADQLQAVLSPREKKAIASQPTKDMAAYDLYLQAKEILHSTATSSQPSFEAQIHLLEDATTRDPAFVPALCLLARNHLLLYWFNVDHSAARLEQARKAIDAAASVQPETGEVHLARAYLFYHGNRDYVPALAELDLARRAMPNNSDVPFVAGLIERRQGQWDESIRHILESFTLDPQNWDVAWELVTNYFATRQYPDAVRVSDEMVRAKPNDFLFLLGRAGVDRACCADLGRTKTVLANPAPGTDPDLIAATRMFLALDLRDFSAAKKALADYKGADFNNGGGFITPREAFQGYIALRLGDSAGAQEAFRAARQKIEARVAKQPENAKALSDLAYVDVYFGRKEDAVREAEHAAELLTVTKDAFDGPVILRNLAATYALTGQRDRAIELLERVARMPNGPSYGDLKLVDSWDSLRGTAPFEKVVASLAPKALPSSAK